MARGVRKNAQGGSSEERVETGIEVSGFWFIVCCCTFRILTFFKPQGLAFVVLITFKPKTLNQKLSYALKK
jgi:hypothetical protein